MVLSEITRVQKALQVDYLSLGCILGVEKLSPAEGAASCLILAGQACRSCVIPLRLAEASDDHAVTSRSAEDQSKRRTEGRTKFPSRS